MTRGPGGPKSGEVLLEFHRIGGSVKVSAVDPETGTEVSIVGPASASEAELRQAVVNKLNYVLARRTGR